MHVLLSLTKIQMHVSSQSGVIFFCMYKIPKKDKKIKLHNTSVPPMSRSYVLLRGHALLHLLVVPVPGTYVLSKYNVLYEYTVYKVYTGILLSTIISYVVYPVCASRFLSTYCGSFSNFELLYTALIDFNGITASKRSVQSCVAARFCR